MNPWWLLLLGWLLMAVVMALSAIFAVVTALSAILAVVIEPSVIAPI